MISFDHQRWIDTWLLNIKYLTPTPTILLPNPSCLSSQEFLRDTSLWPLKSMRCPRNSSSARDFHYIQARISERNRQPGAVRSAVQKMQLCLRAISETGDGTQEDPFRITFLTDADDVVRAWGESVRCQQLVSCVDGYRDVLTAHSGDEFWFDVEVLLEYSSKEAAVARLHR